MVAKCSTRTVYCHIGKTLYQLPSNNYHKGKYNQIQFVTITMLWDHGLTHRTLVTSWLSEVYTCHIDMFIVMPSMSINTDISMSWKMLDFIWENNRPSGCLWFESKLSHACYQEVHDMTIVLSLPKYGILFLYSRRPDNEFICTEGRDSYNMNCIYMAM